MHWTLTIADLVTWGLIAAVGIVLRLTKTGLEAGAKKGTELAIANINWPTELAHAIEKARGRLGVSRAAVQSTARISLCAACTALLWNAALAAASEPASTPLTVEWFSKLLQAVAVLAGGAWAYFRFVRFRTLKKRVEYSFSWKTSPIGGAVLLGILTVKLTNKGNTQIELRKNDRTNDNYRCTLDYGLVSASSGGVPVKFINVRPRDLAPLPFLFKAHRRIEPGETIDDVVVLRVDTSGASAIQFYSQVLTVTRRGKRENMMSSTVAFPLEAKATHCDAISDDEQDDYDRITEVRSILRGWIGEASALLASGLSDPVAQQVAALVEPVLRLASELVPGAKGSSIQRAETCAQGLERICGLLDKRWSDIDENAVLEQVASILRTSLTNDVESRLH